VVAMFSSGGVVDWRSPAAPRACFRQWWQFFGARGDRTHGATW